MKLLLGKDKPWAMLFFIAGVAALTAGLMERTYEETFVVTPSRREALFYLSWSLGLALGAWAACFDEVVGTREFLRQRPIAIATIVRTRMVACLVVMSGWFVLAPIVANLLFALSSTGHTFGIWRQLPNLWANMTPALSGCAIALAAGALPFAWWARLLLAGTALVTTYTLIFWLANDANGNADMTAFVVWHVVIAMAGCVVASQASRHRRDVDRPLATSLRHRVLVPVLAMGVVAACSLQILAASGAIHGLQRTYPRVLVDGDRVVLAMRPHWEKPWTEVDAEHRSLGREFEPSKTYLNANGPAHLSDDIVRLEAPRRPGMSSSGVGGGGRLLVDGDGSAWWQGRDESFDAVEKDGASPRFGPGSKPNRLEGPTGSVILVGDAVSKDVWRFDVRTRRFVAVPLAAGDRFVGFDRARDTVAAPRISGTGVDPSEYRTLVVGEQFVYEWSGEALVPNKAPVKPARHQDERALPARAVGDDVLSWIVEFDGARGIAPFRHAFTPRTFTERSYAGAALLLSAARPPMVQAIAASCGRAARGWQWLFDPLVSNGRRPWLLTANFAWAVLLVWRVRVRLGRLTASRQTRWFWTVVTLLLGPFGWVASLVCERPRAYVRRDLAIPAPAPRIATANPELETVA